jgi:hypothetical protein
LGSSKRCKIPGEELLYATTSLNRFAYFRQKRLQRLQESAVLRATQRLEEARFKLADAESAGSERQPDGKTWRISAAALKIPTRAKP